MNPEDLIVWSDGTSCLGSELYEMSHMSDDYIRLTEAQPYSYQYHWAYANGCLNTGGEEYDPCFIYPEER